MAQSSRSSGGGGPPPGPSFILASTSSATFTHGSCASSQKDWTNTATRPSSSDTVRAREAQLRLCARLGTCTVGIQRQLSINILRLSPIGFANCSSRPSDRCWWGCGVVGSPGGRPGGTLPLSRPKPLPRCLALCSARVQRRGPALDARGQSIVKKSGPCFRSDTTGRRQAPFLQGCASQQDRGFPAILECRGNVIDYRIADRCHCLPRRAAAG